MNRDHDSLTGRELVIVVWIVQDEIHDDEEEEEEEHNTKVTGNW